MSDKINYIIQSLKDGYQPEKIILFGSQASGTASEDSDLDLLLIKETNLPYHERVIAARRFFHSTMPVDLFVLTPQEIDSHLPNNPFIYEAINTGKVIYENNSQCWIVVF